MQNDEIYRLVCVRNSITNKKNKIQKFVKTRHFEKRDYSVDLTAGFNKQ